MPELTDKDYDELDERLTHADIKLSGIPGVFARQQQLLNALDPVSANYLKARAEKTHQTPAQIIHEWVCAAIKNGSEQSAAGVAVL